ncbi:MAG: Ig-like domain-containing protein [Clostridiales bacterium]|nr:Ig-like domain-containing protein [Clostridiales bacterium]
MKLKTRRFKNQVARLFLAGVLFIAFSVSGICDLGNGTLTAYALEYLGTVTLSQCQIGVGETAQFTAESDYEVTYSSDDESIATIDSTGLITGISAGSTKVRATVTVGTRTQSFGRTITVVSDEDTSTDTSGTTSYMVANPSYVFSTVDGQTISTNAGGYDVTVLLFGNVYCINTQNTVKAIANSHWGNESNVRVVFADFLEHPKSLVESFMNTYGSTSMIGSYSVEEENPIRTALYEYLDIASLNGFSYPLIVLIDGNNQVRSITGDGYHSADEIYETISTFANVANSPSTPILTDASIAGSSKVELSACSVSLSKSSYVYNGKARKPSVTVKYDGTKLTRGTDYTVSYSNNKSAGTATVTVTGKGNYSGTVEKTFKIIPKGTSISNLTAKSKGFTVTWKLQKKQTTGYQIQYSTKKSFSNKTTKTFKKTIKNKTITGLKKKTTYYVRIRTYKTVSGKKYYSSWSSVKKIKTE